MISEGCKEIMGKMFVSMVKSVQVRMSLDIFNQISPFRINI